jgi:hypothetical protein
MPREYICSRINPSNDIESPSQNQRWSCVELKLGSQSRMAGGLMRDASTGRIYDVLLSIPV